MAAWPSCATAASCPSSRRSSDRSSAASTLSSTTRTRRATRAGEDAGLAAAGAGVGGGGGGSAKGRRAVNALPFPGPSLRASTRPPWARTMLRTIVSPSPSPPSCRSTARGPWTKASKMRGACRARSRPRRPRPRARPRRRRGGPAHGAARRAGVLRGVDEEVRHHLGEPRQVAHDREVRRRELDVEGVPALLE